MDMANQKRIKELNDILGPDKLVVVLGGSEAEASGLAAETVTMGDPTMAGPLAGEALGLAVYHILEPDIKREVDPGVYEEQVGMMEMVLKVDEIIKEVKEIREKHSRYRLH